MIRTATLEDLGSLAMIFEKYRAFYQKPASLEASTLFLKNRIERHESVIYLALKNNKIIGFTQLYPLFSSTRLKRLWLLNDLYVEENYRGKGVATALINKAKQLCLETDACQLSLETSKTNKEGNIVYPKNGFVLDTTENYYFWIPEGE
ncbi:GNAT family N-acetyltransferase [Elizabethkingia sp. JS20170427COW]|uniref:GNAT family N-acetyltransferase n=1 Tax=Elizabethkingia sp. JS20170427COW TaxID=2583851 RepID=UPI001110CF87|nr:GNAT family N-acetyltransferase [Elizabethkingia sp. JS20170427COW]QCX53552.1 GNAT family N-acetyltransferase [Elizabethkingia sp. JS20170427COW]